MLTREDFDKYWGWFEAQFDTELTEFRKVLLYSKINFVDPYYFLEGLTAVLERYNRNQLPSVDTIAKITLGQCPKEYQQEFKMLKQANQSF